MKQLHRLLAPNLSTLRVSLAVWALFGLTCCAAIFWTMRSHGHSAVRVVAYELLVWLAWAFATPGIAALGRRLPLIPFGWRAASVHVIAALACGLAHCVWWSALYVTIRPFDGMGTTVFEESLRDGLSDRLFLEGTIYFAVLGVTYAVEYQRRLREREVRAAQLEASLAQARLTALELQLQPHFLFNTLHTIGGLVRHQRGPEAIEMIAGLSDVLRFSLDHAGQHLVPLDDELAIARRYLEIQRLRFSDRLRVTIDAPASTRHILVPALLLQPLLENAVRHGIEACDEPGTIAIRAYREGDRLTLVVANSARSDRPWPAASDLAIVEGIGIANTRARLAQLFPDRHAFELTGSADGVVSTISLPAGAA